MVKIALIADIHGNRHALDAVLDHARGQRVDRILILGDLVFKGPLPQECVSRVRELNTTVLQGNIDELVGSGEIQPGFAKSKEMERAIQQEMDWTRARLSAEELNYLNTLPFQHVEELDGGVELRCVHANPRNLLDIVPPDADEELLSTMFEDSSAAITAYAHIHRPYIRFFQGRTILNTGSVGLPFDGDPRASYALLEAGSEGSVNLSIQRVPYDVEAAVQAFEGSGHPFADAVITGLRAGKRP